MKKKSVAFIGSRGIPTLHGGFETFVEELSKKMLEKSDFDIVVVGDREQKMQMEGITEFNTISLIYSKYSKQKQPFLFYLDSLLKVWDADIIYSCGVGNAFFLFIPLIFRKNYITNPDGIGWKRLKWSNNGKKILKLMFYLSAKLSPYILADSVGVENVFRKQFKRINKLETIEYGAYPNKFVGKSNQKITSILEKYQLAAMQYHLVVSRLEPENNVSMILQGFLLQQAKHPLVIVGNLQETNYVKSLTATHHPNVFFLGGVYNKEELEIIRANAFSYLHGHSVGGTNPSLLEAMASKNLCICHDNEHNRGVVKENGFYFSHREDVAEIIKIIEQNDQETMRENVFQSVLLHYNWDSIADRYIAYFNKILKRNAA